MTLLDLLLISFSTYFTYSILTAYSIPSIVKRPFLTICIISGINVLLINSVKDLYLIYFALAAAGIAYFFNAIKLEKILPVAENAKEILIPQDETFKNVEQKQEVSHDESLQQAQLNIKAPQNKPEYRAASNPARTTRPRQKPAKSMPPQPKSQRPIATKVTTVASPITLNDFYKEAAENKMLLSDALVKKLTNRSGNKF